MIKLKTSLLFIIGILTIISCSDDEPGEVEVCETNRYSEITFTDVDSTTVTYASADASTGHTDDLLMDVYTPVGDDLEERPVILWAFGGAFVSGDRSQMAGIARESARRGFVSATIDYRILTSIFPLPDSTDIIDIAVKASSDMKAAVRHFRRDAATSNMFRVDTDNIYVGGLSAGAITALMVGLVDDEDINTPFLQGVIDANGGIDGNTGDSDNRSYSSSVSGVLSLSGGVYDINFLDATDPPIFSVHGDADETVPYGFDFVRVFGFDLVKIHGSKAMFDYAQSIGLRNDLVTIEGGGHVDIYTDAEYSTARSNFYNLGFEFTKEEICQ